ncbi:MAG: response regulator transcription factor [Actinomycetes bacterium]
MTSTNRDETVTVAITEDHPLVLHGLEQLLAAQRPGLRIVWRGHDLSALAAVSPAPDLVLLDLNLGTTQADPFLVRQLIDAGSTVLVVSAMGSPTLVRQLMNVGVAGFVTKSDAPEDLFEAIDTVLSGEPWTSHDLAAVLAASAEEEDPGLTDQERKVLSLYARGLKIDTVARHLGVSPHTVKTYLKRIREKCARVGLPASSATDLYREALREGLVPLE